MEHTKLKTSLGPTLIDGMMIYGINPDNELTNELNTDLCELQRDFKDMNELLDDLGYNIQMDSPKLNIVTKNVIETNDNMELATDVLVTIDEDLNQPTQYKGLKILGGATTGGIVLGVVGVFFGAIPAVVGAGVGAGLGAGITSAVYYVKDKLVNRS